MCTFLVSYLSIIMCDSSLSALLLRRVLSVIYARLLGLLTIYIIMCYSSLSALLIRGVLFVIYARLLGL